MNMNIPCVLKFRVCFRLKKFFSERIHHVYMTSCVNAEAVDISLNVWR